MRKHTAGLATGLLVPSLISLLLFPCVTVAAESRVSFEIQCTAYHGAGDFNNTQQTAIQLINTLGSLDPDSTLSFSEIIIYDKSGTEVAHYSGPGGTSGQPTWPGGFSSPLVPNNSTRFNTTSVFQDPQQKLGLLQVAIKGEWTTKLPPGQLDKISTGGLAQSMVVDYGVDGSLISRAFRDCIVQ